MSESMHPETVTTESAPVCDRELVVSLTSWPGRIACVPRVLDCLLAQTRPADRILLYLSLDQFPGREADLPQELTDAAREGKLTLRFPEGDLKPHKKYFYAFREFPDSLVVTVDDDVLYAPTLLEELLKAHLSWPKAVVAGRAHLITLSPQGDLEPYARWIHRTMGFAEGPSMQLFPVGIGGVLYDPRLFPPDLFREEAFRELCLLGDDLWLKTFELQAGIPVVRCEIPELLRAIPGSQDTALYQANLHGSRNDEMLSALRAWMVAQTGEDPWLSRLREPGYPRVEGREALLTYLNEDKRRLMTSLNRAFVRLESRTVSETTARVKAATTEQVTARVKAKMEEIMSSRLEKQASQFAKEKASLEKQFAREKEALETRLRELEQELEALRSSSSYRLGNALVSPLSRLRRGKEGEHS